VLILATNNNFNKKPRIAKTEKVIQIIYKVFQSLLLTLWYICIIIIGISSNTSYVIPNKIKYFFISTIPKPYYESTTKYLWLKPQWNINSIVFVHNINDIKIHESGPTQQ